MAINSAPVATLADCLNRNLGLSQANFSRVCPGVAVDCDIRVSYAKRMWTKFEHAVNITACLELYSAFTTLFQTPSTKQAADDTMQRIWHSHRGPDQVGGQRPLKDFTKKLLTTNLGQFARTYFQDEPVLIHALTSVRFHRGDATSSLCFHRDLDVLPIQGLTVWIPLQDIDDFTPGIEFGKGNGMPVRPLFMLTEDELRAESKTVVEASPRLKLGQALIFTPDVMHRTRPIAGKERRSIDIRLLPRGNMGNYVGAEFDPVAY